MPGALPHVVILGAGFGGLAAAKALRRAKVRVTIVDKRNHHLFQPLLYQVATAGLAATDIAAPIRRILAGQENTTVVMARATTIDVKNRQIDLEGGDHIAFDYLIVAAGMTNGYFGHHEWAEHAPGLKSLEEALDIRRRVLLAYEAAERETDLDARKRELTFVVIGGGATGVELAGALAEIARRTLTKDFKTFDPKDARVVLIEGGPRLLPAFPEKLSAYTKSDLESLGVEVRLDTRVTKIDAEGVELGDERIDARTVLWGAGVQAVPVIATLGEPTDRQGRVTVEPDLRTKTSDRVFVIGDVAAFKQKDGSPVPGVAPAAMQQGRHAARMIERALDGKPGEPFEYFDKGSMATIGRSKAVAVTGKLQLTGLLAWLAWLFVHLITLIGFRNRLAVMFEWAWAYVSFQRSARIILEKPISAADVQAPEPAAVVARAPPVVAVEAVAGSPV